MRKMVSPSSPHPHALSTGASQGVSRVSLDSQNLGTAGQNYGFFAYLMDLQSKDLHPSAPPAPPPEAPATQINDNGIPQPGTYVNGVKIGESFEVALFLVGMLGLFAIALLACFILSWASPPKKPVFAPQSQHVEMTKPGAAPGDVPLTHYYPNAQYVAMETQLLQPPSIREQQAAIVHQAMQQHAMMQQSAAMQHAAMQQNAVMRQNAAMERQTRMQHGPMQAQLPMYPGVQQRPAMHAQLPMHRQAAQDMHYKSIQPPNAFTQMQTNVSIDPSTGRAR